MWPAKSKSYSPLYSNDESEETITLEKDDIHASETRRWKYVPQTRTSKIGAALLTSILIFLILLTLSLLGSRNMRYDCGHSPAEAAAKNCHFDMLAFAWVPIPCYDAEYVYSMLRDSYLALMIWLEKKLLTLFRLSDTYDTYNDFEFFYDRNRTRQIPIPELKRGVNHRVYTSGKYHRTHCTYAWQTLQRAVLKGYGLSDNKTMNAGRE
jgi:hypothetical protein